MPIYEYRCPNCHQIFEEWCKQVEDGSVTHACPVCAAQAKRLISNTSFALKGQGWYTTEYGSHKGKSEGGAEAVAPSSTTAPAESSPTTAPAASSPLPPPSAPTKAELASTTPTVSSYEHC